MDDSEDLTSADLDDLDGNQALALLAQIPSDDSVEIVDGVPDGAIVSSRATPSPDREHLSALFIADSRDEYIARDLAADSSVVIIDDPAPPADDGSSFSAMIDQLSGEEAAELLEIGEARAPRDSAELLDVARGGLASLDGVRQTLDVGAGALEAGQDWRATLRRLGALIR